MTVQLFRSNEGFVIGIQYDKSVFVDNEHRLIFSFWKWDLEVKW